MKDEGVFYQGVDLLHEGQNIKKTDFIPWLKNNKKKYNLIISEFSLQQVPRKHLWGTVQNIKRALRTNGYFYLASFNEADKFGPYFTQKEYLKIAEDLDILFWNRKNGTDKKSRQRSVTEILLKNKDS